MLTDTRRQGVAVARAQTLVKPIGHGTTGAQLMVDTSGLDWVLKFFQNEQGPRSLVNELLGFQMADVLEIPHPEYALAAVEKGVLPLDGVIRYSYYADSKCIHGSFVAKPGLHFATRLVHSAVQLRPTDLDRQLQIPILLEPLAAIVVLDLVMHHWDRKWLNPNLLLKRDSASKRKPMHRHQLQLIDMGMSLGSGIWEYGNLWDPSFPALNQRLPYAGQMDELLARVTPQGLIASAAKLEGLDHVQIERMIQNIPEEWALNPSVRDALCNWLVQRCQNVTPYIELRLKRQEWWL